LDARGKSFLFVNHMILIGMSFNNLKLRDGFWC